MTDIRDNSLINSENESNIKPDHSGIDAEKPAEKNEADKIKAYVDEAAENLKKLAENEEQNEMDAYASEASENLKKLAENEEQNEIKAYADEASENLKKMADVETSKKIEEFIKKEESLSAAYPEKNVIDNGKKTGKAKKVILIIVAVIVGLILIAYFAGVYFFSKHFGANSLVNGVDCSFMTAEEVESIIADQVNEYSLTIIERNDMSETINGASAGLSYLPDGQVPELIKKQNAYIWPYRFFAESLGEQNTYTSVQLDDKLFASAMDKLNCLDESKMIAPENSYPCLQGGKYIAFPEVPGTTLRDRNEVIAEIRESILGTLDTLDLDEKGFYIDPEITTESEEVTSIVDKYNEYVGLSITYHFGDTTEVLDGDTTDAWFTWDENMNATLDKNAVKAWTVEFGKKHDTLGIERKFKNPDGLEITVKGGIYGWSVDEKAEYNMILQMYEEKKSQDREPIWEQTAAAFGDKDFGDEYIEVNLSTQHMIYWKGTEKVFENDVITGTPIKSRETPEGTWFILEMKQNKVLRGAQLEDGTYEYESPVDYWMRVTWSGVGFHDATWQYWGFGGNLYETRGSHGCINMSYEGAKTLYSLVHVGLPVIIHK